MFHKNCLPLLAFSLIVIISSPDCFFLILCAFNGQPDKLTHTKTQHTAEIRPRETRQADKRTRLNETVEGEVKCLYCLECKKKRQPSVFVCGDRTKGTSPSVSDKNIIGMSEAIAAGQGTMGQFLLICLPRKG